MAVEAVANGLLVVANVANNVPQAPIANKPHYTQANHAAEDPTSTCVREEAKGGEGVIAR